MFVKLQWTQDKQISQIFKLITYIINTPAVAAVTDITSALTNAAIFNSQTSVYAGWDPTNSYIYRTGTGNNALTTGNTTAKFCKLSSAAYGWNFFLQQTAYDASTHKIVYGINSFSASSGGGLIYNSHRQSTNGDIIGSITQELTTTNNVNSATTTAVGFSASGLATGITIPVTIVSTNVTGNIVTITNPANIQISKGMRFIVTGVATTGGLSAGTYTILSPTSATQFTITSGDYNGSTSNTALTLSTASTGFTNTYSLEVAADSDSAWSANGAAYGAPSITSSVENTVRTAWFYITDNCFLLSVANSSGGNTGLPASNNLSLANYQGPYFQAQYTRTDPWNTSSNGILPWIMTNPYKYSTGGAFGHIVTDLDNLANPLAQNATLTLPLASAAHVDARPSTTATSWTKQYYQPINYGAGPRYNELIGLTGIGNTNAGTTVTAFSSISYPSIGTALFKTSGVRWWSADLTKKTYMMLPITWRHNAYSVSGGNITDRTGIYWFNGDYYPGDTLTFNSKTYVLMPLGVCQNDTYRVAFAIPRE